MSIKNFVLIPFWVENVLNRNNIDIIDILNYSKLKSILSTNDLAQLKSLQTIEEISSFKELDGKWYLFNSWMNSAQESEKVELDSVINQLSCSKDLQQDLLDRLSLEYAPLVFDESASKYKILDLNRDVTAIVLNPGFIDFERDQMNQFNLISDLLKSLYVYSTFSEVSNYSLFNKYVQSLEDNLRK